MSLDPLIRIPKPGKQRLAIRVKPQVERVLRSGHPWLYEQAVTHVSREGVPGDIAIVFDRKKRFLAAGLYDPASPIRVRLLVHREPETISQPLFARRLEAAGEIRAPLAGSGTNGYRLVHGANDGMPGIVVDRYDQTFVLKLYSAAWIPHLRFLLDELIHLAGPERVVLRLSRNLQNNEEALYGLVDGQTLFGKPVHGPIGFTENGFRFEADVLRGQKTGFFLDQRDNREKVGRLAKAGTVLNAFSYSGGFSLYAARGGAVKVTDIDQSRPALAAARRHFDLNLGVSGVAATKHQMIAGDVFSVLPDLAAADRRYDMVILDPPAFARRQEQLPRALKAYGRLARLGLALLKPGGILVSSSCSSRVTANTFFEIVNEAALSERRRLRELERTGHALDHPISFKEGAYLKTLFAKAY